METELEQCRKRGVAVTHGERDSNTTSIAAPILGPAGEVLGVISVNGPSERLASSRVKEIASVLLDELALDAATRSGSTRRETLESARSVRASNTK